MDLRRERIKYLQDLEKKTKKASQNSNGGPDASYFPVPKAIKVILQGFLKSPESPNTTAGLGDSM